MSTTVETEIFGPQPMDIGEASSMIFAGCYMNLMLSGGESSRHPDQRLLTPITFNPSAAKGGNSLNQARHQTPSHPKPIETGTHENGNSIPRDGDATESTERYRNTSSIDCGIDVMGSDRRSWRLLGKEGEYIAGKAGRVEIPLLIVLSSHLYSCRPRIIASTEQRTQTAIMGIGKTVSEVTTNPSKMAVTTATDPSTQQYVPLFGSLDCCLSVVTGKTSSGSSSFTVSFRLSEMDVCRITSR
jgi:hypothetical protein